MATKQAVLIVDDDEGVREMLAKELKPGYDVLIAKDGVDAVRLYERNSEVVAGMVIAMEIPRLNAQSVTEWVHHIRPRLPVILMSGPRDSRQDIVCGSEYVTFLAKPFETSRINGIISGQGSR